MAKKIVKQTGLNQNLEIEEIFDDEITIGYENDFLIKNQIVVHREAIPELIKALQSFKK